MNRSVYLKFPHQSTLQDPQRNLIQKFYAYINKEIQKQVQNKQLSLINLGFRETAHLSLPYVNKSNVVLGEG